MRLSRQSIRAGNFTIGLSWSPKAWLTRRADAPQRSPSNSLLPRLRTLPPLSVSSKAGAKPLRVKVPKSKERALIREFGLDSTALTEEESEKRRSELTTLIKMGKSRGFLTQQEINDHLPGKLLEAEVIEAIVTMLNDMGIAVYEQAPDAATLLVAGGAGTASSDEDAEEAAQAALSTVDSEFGRTTDPVRMYMRDMGLFDLLTREGEIEIAKRIEAGQQAMMLAISASPSIMAEVLAYGDKVASGEWPSPQSSTVSWPPTRPTTTWPRKIPTPSTTRTTKRRW